MKIVMVCEFFDDELEYQENLLAKYYQRLGHDVVIITSRVKSVVDYISGRAGDLFPEGEAAGLYAKIIRLPWRINLLNRFCVFPSLYRVFQRERPDLIYFHDIIPNLIEAANYASERPEVRVIMDYHADYSNSGANWLSRRILHGVIRRFVLNHSRPRLSMIFPVVPGSAYFLKDLYGVTDAEMELLPLGVDLDAVHQFRSKQTRDLMRRRLGIPPDALVVFTGGKLTPGKRTEVLLEAARNINNPALHVVVVGRIIDETYRSVIEAAAAGLANVHFVGWQDRKGIYCHMAASDVAVFPASQSVLWQQSLGMGLPLVVAESSPVNPHPQDISYMNAFGACTVVGRAGDVRGDIERILVDFMRNPDLRAEAVQRAVQTAEEVLNYEQIALRTLRFNAT